MARQITPLTDSKIKRAKASTKRERLRDGQGLCLDILPTGKKSWLFRYQP
jgi:hypothetical protein